MFDYIRDYYGVPAEKGRRVKHQRYGLGTITKARNQYIYIALDEEMGKVTGPFHPTDNLAYLDGKGNQIWPALNT